MFNRYQPCKTLVRDVVLEIKHLSQIRLYAKVNPYVMLRRGVDNIEKVAQVVEDDISNVRVIRKLLT